MSLTKSKKHIQRLDLRRIEDKLSSADLEITHLGKHWSKKKAKAAIRQYKRYLWIARKYRDQHPFIPPSAEIDQIWHSHILDTRAYSRDCEAIFGELLHHDPYFGLRSKRERSNLNSSFQLTQKLFRREFGEPLYSLEDL